MTPFAHDPVPKTKDKYARSPESSNSADGQVAGSTRTVSRRGAESGSNPALAGCLEGREGAVSPPEVSEDARRGFSRPGRWTAVLLDRSGVIRVT